MTESCPLIGGMRIYLFFLFSRPCTRMRRKRTFNHFLLLCSHSMDRFVFSLETVPILNNVKLHILKTTLTIISMTRCIAHPESTPFLFFWNFDWLTKPSPPISSAPPRIPWKSFQTEDCILHALCYSCLCHVITPVLHANPALSWAGIEEQVQQRPKWQVVTEVTCMHLGILLTLIILPVILPY